MEKITVLIKPRIHQTLLAMHQGEYRINGGLGFSIQKPQSQLATQQSLNFSIDDIRPHGLIDSEKKRLIQVLKQEQTRCHFKYAANIYIKGSMSSHNGFGSGTAITLASLEALHLLNEHTPTELELVKASGRGGTSGIGINTYFRGGCVFDLGKSKDEDNLKHIPSNQSKSTKQPLLVDQFGMPDWLFGLCVPRYLPLKTQAEEKAFFERICPIEKTAAYETIYHTLFGLYASLKEQNKIVFCDALKAVQQCAWKKAERLEYGAVLSTLEESIYANGADCVGMSSLGPCLFFLADDVESMIEKMQTLHPECDWYVTKADNQGREITYD